MLREKHEISRLVIMYQDFFQIRNENSYFSFNKVFAFPFKNKDLERKK